MRLPWSHSAHSHKRTEPGETVPQRGSSIIHAATHHNIITSTTSARKAGVDGGGGGKNIYFLSLSLFVHMRHRRERHCTHTHSPTNTYSSHTHIERAPRPPDTQTRDLLVRGVRVRSYARVQRASCLIFMLMCLQHAISNIKT